MKMVLKSCKSMQLLMILLKKLLKKLNKKNKRENLVKLCWYNRTISEDIQVDLIMIMDIMLINTNQIHTITPMLFLKIKMRKRRTRSMMNGRIGRMLNGTMLVTK